MDLIAGYLAEATGTIRYRPAFAGVGSRDSAE
jgi:hypothetical protein